MQASDNCIPFGFPNNNIGILRQGLKYLRSYAAAAVQGPLTDDRLGYFNRDWEAQNDLLQRFNLAT